MDYPGKIINKNATLPTQASASGVWTVDDALIALRSNTWPIAGVLNPISKSLRFNSADSAYLNRTPASASNRKTWTWSAWVKRSALSGNAVFSAGDGSTGNRAAIDFDSDQFRVIFGDGTSLIGTTQVFRDPSAWYHFVVAVDTTQATASNRVKLYVNGSEITALSSASYPAQNYDTFVNATNLHTLGARYRTSVDSYFNGYMTEINFIDGQALTPSSFGATDAQTGQWIPKKYTGTYGTNGFYVNFSDSASTGALGTDYSGNGNNWTPNNFSVTAGAGNDSLTDVPTPWIAYSTNSEVGGVIRGNYSTWNPLDNGGLTLVNGNLDVSDPASYRAVRSTIGMQSGKWYFELTATSGLNFVVGIAKGDAGQGSYLGSNAGGWGYSGNDGRKYNNAVDSVYGATFTNGDTIGVAFDADVGTLVFYKNNVSQGTAFTGLTSGPYFFSVSTSSSTAAANFGQRPFAYTPPAGYKSLCATNLPTPTIGATTTTQADRFFTPNLWSGNGGAQTITNNIDTTNGGGLIWFKGRNLVVNNFVINSNSGYTKFLASNTTAAEDTFDFGFTPSTTGFSFNSGSGSVNQSGYTYVAWQWKAGGTGVTNTAGSITSTVSANTTSGFSIVTWTGNSANATIGHGLGVAPRMVIIKYRGTTDNWYVYNANVGTDKYLVLNATDAAATSTSIWQNTAPTSTVFSIGSGNNNSTIVAYCFAEVAGYSRIGSYTGNGSTDGPFIFTGFRPAFVLIKCSSATSDWWLYDTKRGTFNVLNAPLYPNGSFAESPTSALDLDILSNGFKSRSNNGTVNGSGNTYIFAAFAEFPFKFANAR